MKLKLAFSLAIVLIVIACLLIYLGINEDKIIEKESRSETLEGISAYDMKFDLKMGDKIELSYYKLNGNNIDFKIYSENKVYEENVDSTQGYIYFNVPKDGVYSIQFFSHPSEGIFGYSQGKLDMEYNLDVTKHKSNFFSPYNILGFLIIIIGIYILLYCNSLKKIEKYNEEMK